MKKVFFFLAITVSIPILLNAQPSKSFKWVLWKNVTAKIKAELKKIIDHEDATAYDNIIETIQEGCTAAVAVLDMDGDGKMEYAVGFEGSMYCCGRGCTLLVYKNLGKKQVHLVDEWENAKPAKNGVISSMGKLIAFETAKW